MLITLISISIVILLCSYFMLHRRLPDWGRMHMQHQKMADDIDTKQKQMVKSIYDDVIKIERNTRKELGELIIMSEHLDDPVSYGHIFNTKTHKDLYIVEDSDLRETFMKYIKYMNVKFNSRLNTDEIIWKTIAYHDAIILNVKDAINRCRPHQASKIYGIPFTYQHNVTATTASFPSGHAAQGMMFALIMHKECRHIFNKHPEELDILKRYGVDVGLRRNYAGLHYLSDNVASLAAVKQFIDDPLYNWDKDFFTSMEKYFYNSYI